MFITTFFYFSCNVHYNRVPLHVLVADILYVTKFHVEHV